MYHMKSRREPYINIENKSKTPSPWMHGGGVFYIMGESVGISYYINSPAGRIFSCINLKSCNLAGDGGRDGVPALALTVTEKYFWIA